MAAVTIHGYFGAQENKACLCFHCFSIYLHEVMEPDDMILVFWILSFKPDFSVCVCVCVCVCSSSDSFPLQVIT